MYSDPICLSSYAKKLAKGSPLVPFFATPAKQIEPLYMLFNYGVQDATR